MQNNEVLTIQLQHKVHEYFKVNYTNKKILVTLTDNSRTIWLPQKVGWGVVIAQARD